MVWLLSLLISVCVIPFTLAQDQEQLGFSRFFGNEEKNSIFNSNNIISWEPIASNISVGDVDYYEFTIDQSTSGQGFAPTYEVLIFMSGNIRQYPLYLPNDTETMTQNIKLNVTQDIELAIRFSFNESLSSNLTMGTYQPFSNGYTEALAVSPIKVDDTTNGTLTYSNLYVLVQLCNSTTQLPLETSSETDGMVWDYDLGISESDLIYQWDERSWVDVLDTDDISALLMSGNVTNDNVGSSTNYTVYDPSLYDVYIYTEEEFQLLTDADLEKSISAIKNGRYLTTSEVELETSKDLDEKALRVQKYIAASSNGMSEYFYVTGLNSSTTYVSILVKKVVQMNNLTDVGGIIFAPETFTTKKDDTCSLIHSLNFCQGVAYSVPSSSLSGQNKTLLAATYEYISTGLYTNFTNALQLISCDADLDARYSPFRTCEDCAQAYKNWLCTVTIPRCTTDESPYYILRKQHESRNSFINSYIKPLRDYYEILPCIDMCHYMVRDCPSDFGFACPNPMHHEELLLNSYNYYIEDSDVTTCNMLRDN